MKAKFLSITVIMISIVSICAYTLAPANSGNAEVAGIDFYNGSLDQAIAESKRENKPLFLFIYADWCPHCQRMENQTFQNREIAAYLNEHFVNFKVNGEERPGPRIMRKYKVQGYPGVLFLDNEGKVFYRIQGFQSAEQLSGHARNALQVYSDLK